MWGGSGERSAGRSTRTGCEAQPDQGERAINRECGGSAAALRSGLEGVPPTGANPESLARAGPMAASPAAVAGTEHSAQLLGAVGDRFGSDRVEDHDHISSCPARKRSGIRGDEKRQEKVSYNRQLVA